MSRQREQVGPWLLPQVAMNTHGSAARCVKLSCRALLLAASLVGSAVAQDRPLIDRTEAAYLTLLAIDWSQTRYIAKNPDRFREINPLLGEHPSLGKVNNYFVASALVNIAAVHYLPERYRKPFQYLTIGFEATTVAHNYSIGIKLDW
jgi:hypothetical protein